MEKLRFIRKLIKQRRRKYKLGLERIIKLKSKKKLK
jgi:hypothetical protein